MDKPEQIGVGQWHKLSVKQQLEYGAVLDGGQLGDVFLSKKHHPESLTVGSQIKVFLYHGSDGELLATTQQPLIEVGKCAYLQVVEVNKIGAFLACGLPKDLLLPYAEQRGELRKGQHLAVFVYQNQASGKLVASMRLNKFLSEKNRQLKPKQQVEIMIIGRTDLGYKVVINDQLLGLIHRHDVYRPLLTGQRHTAYVKQIREDDKVNVALHLPNKQQIGDLSERILQHLKQHGGVSDLTDKSDPEAIKRQWQVSKGSYKKAIGKLYKQRKITISPRQISLVDEQK